MPIGECSKGEDGTARSSCERPTPPALTHPRAPHCPHAHNRFEEIGAPTSTTEFITKKGKNGYPMSKGATTKSSLPTYNVKNPNASFGHYNIEGVASPRVPDSVVFIRRGSF